LKKKMGQELRQSFQKNSSEAQLPQVGSKEKVKGGEDDNEEVGVGYRKGPVVEGCRKKH